MIDSIDLGLYFGATFVRLCQSLCSKSDFESMSERKKKVGILLTDFAEPENVIFHFFRRYIERGMLL